MRPETMVRWLAIALSLSVAAGVVVAMSDYLGAEVTKAIVIAWAGIAVLVVADHERQPI